MFRWVEELPGWTYTLSGVQGSTDGGSDEVATGNGRVLCCGDKWVLESLEGVGCGATEREVLYGS